MGESSQLNRRLFMLPIGLGLLAALAACDDVNVKLDPHMAELEERAHKLVDPIVTESDLVPYEDVSATMCAGVDKTWLPTTAGKMGDVGVLWVPGSVVPPALNANDFPPVPPEILTTYEISFATKNIDWLTPVAVMLSYDPATKACSADIWTSGP